MVPFRFSSLFLLPFLLLFSSCSQDSVGPPPLGEAYAGPASLPLRQDISLRSAVSGMARHGDRLEVLEAKRRFVKVKTPQGQLGWVDVRLLMSPEQMKGLRDLKEQALKMPSEGTAVVLEAVNMHTEPNRLAPSFAQLAEKTAVQIVDRKVTLRSQSAPRSMSFSRRTVRRRPVKKKPGGVDIPPPAPPGPPANWLALSQTPKMEKVDERPASESKDGKALRSRKKEGPASDDWSLVRVKNGSAGWVLSRMLNMAIPDDVAQYSEGRRITSYFSLGQINDEENGMKDHWLWTTMAGVRSDCDFDSFRVFIWNRRRHRYETAYMEKRLLGRYPVEANIDGKVGSFAVITQNDDGKWVRRTFALEGYQVHKLGEEPYIPGETPRAGQAAAQAGAKAEKRGWFSSIAQRLHKLFAK